MRTDGRVTLHLLEWHSALTPEGGGPHSHRYQQNNLPNRHHHAILKANIARQVAVSVYSRDIFQYVGCNAKVRIKWTIETKKIEVEIIILLPGRQLILCHSLLQSFWSGIFSTAIPLAEYGWEITLRTNENCTCLLHALSLLSSENSYVLWNWLIMW